jgi:septal ring factor EnvC (AmiA/AmiB activator)
VCTPIDVSSFADYGKEKLLNKLVGRTGMENALHQLDSLTKEEGLLMAARNLEVTCLLEGNMAAIKEAMNELIHDADDNVTTIKEAIHDVDSNLNETKQLTYKVGDHIKVIEQVAHNIDDNVKATKDCTHC